MAKKSETIRPILVITALLALGLWNIFSAMTSSAQTDDESTDKKFQKALMMPSAVYPGTGVGAIADSTTNGTYGTPLVVNFNVSGVTQTISSVTVDVTMTHTWIGDLDVVLAAPGGSPSIPIFSRVGATTATAAGDSSNLSGRYLFRDQSTLNIWTVATAAACGTDCIVTPEVYRTTAPGGAGQTNPPPFTNLTATFSGLTPAQANGVWTLTFRDRATGDTGTVTAANLDILTGGATPTPTPAVTPTPTPVPGAFQDGGFEQNTGTTVITNPFWSSTSTAFTTSLCTTAACGNGAGTAGQRTGNGWVWFDGASDTATAAETGTAQQSFIIPVGATQLSYYLRIGRTNAPNSSTLTVSVDGAVLQTINEPAVPETAYTERRVNIGAYANGASHTILFTYNRPSANGDSFTIDDVSLILAPTAADTFVAGRVLTRANRGVSRAVVQVTMPDGETRFALTNAFGYFRFEDMEVGQTYIFSINHKKHTFAPQVVSLSEQLTEMVFTEQ